MQKGLKSHRGFSTNIKSNTVINLPGINRLPKFSPRNKNQNKSSYIQAISYLSGNVQYDNKNTIQINKQHIKLRQILKKMNEDTLHIIDELKPKNFQIKPSRQQISLVRDRQIQNNKKMISNLSYDIQKLKEKHNKIVQHQQRQQLQKRIKQIREQIQLIKGNNTNSKLAIFKDGKEMIKEQNDEYDIKFNILENDKYLFELKVQKLRNQNTRVEEELKKIQNKSIDIDNKLKSYEEQFNLIKNKQLQENTAKIRLNTIKNKKIQHETIKKKIQNINNYQQFKYYKRLKDLEYQSKSLDLVKNKVSQITQKILKTKIQANDLQKELKFLKQTKMQKSRMVLQYIEKQRKNKQQNTLNGGQTIILSHNESLVEQIKENNNAESVLHNRKWENEANIEQIKINNESIQNIEQNQSMHVKIQRQKSREIRDPDEITP